MSSFKMILVAAIAAAGAVACGPDYDHTDIKGIVTGPLGGEIDTNHVTVTQGTLIKVHIESINSDNHSMTNDISTENANVMDAIQVVSDRDYAFLGNTPGDTTIDIRADDKVVLRLAAHVAAQPAAP